MEAFTVEIWADIICPWCYIGEHRFQRALANFAHRDAVTIIHRSFQLDPAAPRDSHQSNIEMLSQKYGKSPDETLRMEQQMVGMAAREDLPMQARRMITNTLDAHRLLQLAIARGHADALVQRLFAAHFAEQQSIGDHPTLARLAAEAGLDRSEAEAVLASAAYTDEVRADRQLAAELGIRGVPFFVLDQRYGVSGAQSPEVLLDALNQAWNARPHTSENLS